MPVQRKTVRRMKKEQTNKKDGSALVHWMIHSIDGESYRAGKLKGVKHPRVDADMIRASGGLQSLIDQAEELEREGLLKAEWFNLHADLKRLEYPVNIMPQLCLRAGLEDPRKRQLRYIAGVRVRMEEVRGTFLETYYSRILERLENGKAVKKPDMEDGAFFRCLNALALSDRQEWKRSFSTKVLGNSKLFEQKYEEKVLTVLREWSPLYEEGMEPYELLAAHGILTYSQTLEWKGPLIYHIENGADIDSSVNIFGTVINAQTLEHACPVSVCGIRRILLVENKANYESLDYSQDTLCIFCHGFFSPKELRFLKQLVHIIPEQTECLHWGDMDLGGIRIFLYNRKKLFPNLFPYRMDVESYKTAVAAGNGIHLEADKREKLELLDTDGLEELKELKECILECGLEIEQESQISAGIQQKIEESL